MKFMPIGIQTPQQEVLDAFWLRACEAKSELQADTDYKVRWIGLDRDTTLQIFDLIGSRDKCGTFTLPWLAEAASQPEPVPGEDIVLVDVDGRPHQVVRLGAVSRVNFGEIGPEHTRLDGPPVRPIEIWKPLHTQYWNALLEPHGRQVTAEMPVWIEPFELVYWET